MTRPHPTWVLVASVVTASACASAGPRVVPLTGPQAAARVRSFEGSPLSGPVPIASSVVTAEPAGPTDAWRVQVEWFVLRDPAVLGLAGPVALEPLVQRTRLVVIDPDVEPRFGPSVLARGAVLARVPDVEAFARALRERPDAMRVAVQRGALAPGVTNSFELTEAGLALASSWAGWTSPARVALQVHRGAPGEAGRSVTAGAGDDEGERSLSAGFGSSQRGAEPGVRGTLGGVTGAVQDAAAPADLTPARIALDLEAPGLSPSHPCRPGPRRHEVVLLDAPLPPGGGGLAAALPSPFRHPGQPGTVWLLALATAARAPEPGEPSYAAHIEAFAAATSDVERSRALVYPPPATLRPATGVAALPAVEAMRAALGEPGEQRRVLLAIADATGAELTRDLALMGERRDVDRLSAAMARRLADPTLPRDEEPLRWVVERLSLDVLRDRIVARELSPALSTVLERLAGAVADRPALLALVDVSHDATHLEELLVDENLSLLDDPSPAVRARAAAWLRRRRPGLLPGAYDPMAPSRERRAALAGARAGDAPPPDPAGQDEEPPR